MLQEQGEEYIQGLNSDDMHSMQQKIEEIKNVWNPVFPVPSDDGYSSSYSPAHCGRFSGTHVNFDLFAIVTGRTEFTFHLTKSPCDAANATLQIVTSGSTLKTFRIEKWTNDRISGELTVPFSLIDLYGKSIEFKITWNGFLNTSDNPLPEQLVLSIVQGAAIVLVSSVDLYDHVKHFLKSPELSDMTVMVKGEEIPVHKIVLGSQSAVFTEMFKSGLPESTSNQIEIQDVDRDTMNKVIKFLYTGKVDEANLTIDETVSILAVADKYEIIELKDLCGNILWSRLTKDNAVKILEQANLYKLENLIEIAIVEIMDHKQHISQSEDFEDLYSRKPDIFFQFVTRMMNL